MNDKRRRPGESRDAWLERIGFTPLTDDQKRANLEANLMYFCNTAEPQRGR